MNKNKLIFSSLGILFGIFLIIYCAFDDSPGGQIIGLVLIIAGIIGIIRRRK